MISPDDGIGGEMTFLIKDDDVFYILFLCEKKLGEVELSVLISITFYSST